MLVRGGPRRWRPAARAVFIISQKMGVGGRIILSDFVQFCQKQKDEGARMEIKEGIVELIERATMEQLALILRFLRSIIK